MLPRAVRSREQRIGSLDFAAGQESYERHVQAHFRWNFAANLWDIAFITFGLNLVSQTTIMPLLVSELTASRVAIGLIPAIYSLGYLLPQLLMANFVMLLGGLGERLPYLLISLAILWLARPAPALALILFFLLLAATATSNGMATPAWYSMIAKVIPTHKRGLWSGMARSLGALLGIAGAAFSGRLLANWSFPQNYGYSFLLAFLFAAISWIGLASNREPVSPTVKPRTSLGSYLRQLPGVLRRDANYVHFVVARSVTSLGTMAAGFLMVYGKESIQGAIEQVGTLTAILVGTQAVMNLAWGLVGDRVGHKIVLCGAAALMAITAAVGWLASSPAWLWATFALLGAATSAESVSQMNIILEFCAPEDRPTYIGLTNTLLAPAQTLGPILGGALATWFSYRTMFAVAAIVSITGAMLLLTWVREPRHAQREQRVAPE
jgi:MFS family permease